jgi:hypothetical protein
MEHPAACRIATPPILSNEFVSTLVVANMMARFPSAMFVMYVHGIAIDKWLLDSVAVVAYKCFSNA